MLSAWIEMIKAPMMQSRRDNFNDCREEAIELGRKKERKKLHWIMRQFYLIEGLWFIERNGWWQYKNMCIAFLAE